MGLGTVPVANLETLKPNYIFELPVWTVAHRGRTLSCRIPCMERPRTLRIGFVGTADIKNAFHQMRILGLPQAFFCIARCFLASEVCYTRKRGARNDLFPIL